MCDNMVKEIKMSAEEAIEYVRENVQIRDILEISYNRIFAPGEVLNIISEDEEKKYNSDIQKWTDDAIRKVDEQVASSVHF